ncbi:MAG: hypothetical protein QF681_12095 [Vicinamibacterales bacterium]|jgi:hypothetical protein|nr:hypothetical protein [Vicinamibacterales bacterium]
MNIRRLTAAGLLIASLVAALFAQPDRPELRTTLDQAVITIGDTVSVVVSVTHAVDARVVWPDSIALDPFELLDVRPLESVPEGTQTRSSAELTVTAFELGELTLPPFDVAVVDGGGAAVTLQTAASIVTVESVGRDEGGDIRDIKGPLEIPFSVVTLLPWLAGLAGLGAIAYWLYRRYRDDERPDFSAPVVPPRPAHEVAYESLNALEASGLLELGEVKTYHIRISDIMRVYVEGRFSVDAMEMTTGEVLGGLRRADASSGVVADFRQLLDRCDLVKFAKFRPDVPTCRDLAPLGRRLVDVTKPAEPVPGKTPEEAPA